MNNKKILIPLSCFFTDAALAVYTYLSLTNYQRYQEYIKAAINSPDFQLDIYRILVQTLTMTLLIFLLLHAVLYFFFFKGKKWAITYVRFYTLLAFLSMGISIALSASWPLILPTLIYGIAFFYLTRFRKAF